MFHKILVAALVVAPMAMAPMDGAAQQRGSAGAQVAGSEIPAASQTGAAPAQGLSQAFDGRTPPSVLQRIFPSLFSQSTPEAAPDPEPEEPCDTSFAIVNGQWVMVDCNGNVLDP